MSAGRVMFVFAALAFILDSVGFHPAVGLEWLPLGLFFLAMGLVVG